MAHDRRGDGGVSPAPAWRVLCLGNDLLADDGFGPAVAQTLRNTPVEVVVATAAGWALLDYLSGVPNLLVVDTIATGRAAPGTVLLLEEEDLLRASGASPHGLGLLETLALARALRLPVPGKIVWIAVEAADCSTVGGAMHPAVRAAVPAVAERIRKITAICDGG